MNAGNSNLVNRLILLILCLNFVCLVLLLARSYRKPGDGADRAALAASQVARPSSEHLELPSNTTEQPARPLSLNRNSGSTTRTNPVPARKPALVQTALPPVEVIPAPTAPVLVNLPAGRPIPPQPAGATSDGWPRLSGRVFLKGLPPPEIPFTPDAVCRGLNPGQPMTTRHYVVGPDGGLANVLVYVSNKGPAPPLGPAPVLEQVSCLFEPYVLGVVTGQSLVIRNSDPVLHNIHATPKHNREFNFAQAPTTVDRSISFSVPEHFIRFKCDVHPWELAYVSVLEHPFFSITDTNGYFQIPPGLPPGEYVVAAAHLKAGGAKQTVEVQQGEQRVLSFELTPARTQARR